MKKQHLHVRPGLIKEQLVSQCKELGLCSGDTVMIHASIHSVGEILGGPDALIDAILSSIEPDGTIMVFVGCQSPYDDVGRGLHSREDEEFILEHCPTFDPDCARANREFGILAEIFRTRPGVRVSRNPGARMAALGFQADALTQGHSLDYGFGRGSPLEKLCRIGGKVLLLGSDPENTTLLHYAEAIAPIPEKKIVRIKIPLLENGQRKVVDIEEFNSTIGICDWPDGFFADIVSRFIESHHCVPGMLGNATTYCLEADPLVKFAVPIIVQTAQQLARLRLRPTSR